MKLLNSMTFQVFHDLYLSCDLHKSIFLLIHYSLDILPFQFKNGEKKKHLKRSSLSKHYNSSDFVTSASCVLDA